MKSMCSRQSGFAAIAAIFLVVLLAGLGAFMLTFSNTQQLTSAQDIQGSRAYWAARAGLEWAAAKVTSVSDPSTLVSTTCTTVSPFSINTFSVSVSCTVATYTEAGESRYLLQFRSIASKGGSPVGSVGYIERSLSASMEK